MTEGVLHPWTGALPGGSGCRQEKVAVYKTIQRKREAQPLIYEADGIGFSVIHKPSIF
jgi:hypothetical protein